MNDDRTRPLAGALNPSPVVHQLPAPKHRAPHQFGDPVFVPLKDIADIFARNKTDRTGQTERTCPLCCTVKITVHGIDGGGWREWRSSDRSDNFHDVQYASSVEPPCVPKAQP